MLTIQITEKYQIEGVRAAASTHAGLAPTTPPMDAQAWLQRQVEVMCDSLGDTYSVDAVPSGDFVLRFDADEFYAINSAAKSDPILAGFLARVRESVMVYLSSTEVTQGMQYLVALELLTPERAAEITAWGTPEPQPEPEEEE